ncbi:hypothetical protein HPB50_028118 [Hyalomma asiaticum]|nr:hypothetical protein HPB50_028118 [Hyalomma asiaticum]
MDSAFLAKEDEEDDVRSQLKPPSHAAARDLTWHRRSCSRIGSIANHIEAASLYSTRPVVPPLRRQLPPLFLRNKVGCTTARREVEEARHPVEGKLRLAKMSSTGHTDAIGFLSLRQRCRLFPPLLPLLQEPFRCERLPQQTTPKQGRGHGSVSSASEIGTGNTKQIPGHRGKVSAQPKHFFGTSSRPLPASSARNSTMGSGKERHRLGNVKDRGTSSGNVKGLQEGELCTPNITFPPVLQVHQELVRCGCCRRAPPVHKASTHTVQCQPQQQALQEITTSSLAPPLKRHVTAIMSQRKAESSMARGERALWSMERKYQLPQGNAKLCGTWNINVDKVDECKLCTAEVLLLSPNQLRFEEPMLGPPLSRVKTSEKDLLETPLESSLQESIGGNEASSIASNSIDNGPHF